MADAITPTRRRTVSAWDIPRIFLAPRRLFARVENVPAYGWALVVLLTAVTLHGYASVQSGLMDREVEKKVQQRIAKLDLESADVVARSELSKQIEEIKKAGRFEAFLTRMRETLLAPVSMLISVLLLSAVFYGMVALTGRKPEWHTLMTICVFAGFVDLAGMVLRLILMLRYGSLDVDTSLGILVRRPFEGGEAAAPLDVLLPPALSGFDPFRLWYWGVVIVGLSTTAQLRGWRAWVVCALLWLLAAGVRTGAAAAMAFS
jgi:hypothetical protein